MTESTSEGSRSCCRAMLSTSLFTVALGSGWAFETGGGPGEMGEMTFGVTTRDAMTAVRTRRPLWESARTAVVTRVGGGSGGAASSPKVASAIAPSIKQKRIALLYPGL